MNKFLIINDKKVNIITLNESRNYSLIKVLVINDKKENIIALNEPSNYNIIKAIVILKHTKFYYFYLY